MLIKLLGVLISVLPGLVPLYERLVQALADRAAAKSIEVAQKTKDTSGIEDLFKGK